MIHKTETRKDGEGNTVIEKKYNHLVAAEMMKESNYNQIDGIINNSSKPTFEERMREAKIKAKKHNNRRGERHKGARHSNQSDRHNKEKHKKKNKHSSER